MICLGNCLSKSTKNITETLGGDTEKTKGVIRLTQCLAKVGHAVKTVFSF